MSGVKVLELVRFCKLLADLRRVQIVVHLQRQPLTTVTELTELLSESRPAVSHHLALLRMDGLIERHREGKSNLYSLQGVGYQLATAICDTFGGEPGDLDGPQMVDAAQICKLLADPVRLPIVKLLYLYKSVHMERMSHYLHEKPSTVAHSLQLLETSGLIQAHSEDVRIFSFTPRGMTQVVPFLNLLTDEADEPPYRKAGLVSIVVDSDVDPDGLAELLQRLSDIYTILSADELVIRSGKSPVGSVVSV